MGVFEIKKEENIVGEEFLKSSALIV